MILLLLIFFIEEENNYFGEWKFTWNEDYTMGIGVIWVPHALNANPHIKYLYS